ncbi:MAG: HAMP domain-containing sensor histidine kinase, partial [Bacteroidota bacterium]
DLKAPLNSLMGLIDILESESKDPNVLTYLRLMDKSVVKLDTFIRNLTDFSRITRIEIQHQPVDVEELVTEIDESLRYMENSGTVIKSVVVHPGVPLVSDGFHLGIVLGNLISNAVKYLDKAKENQWVRVEVFSNPDHAKIIVEDNGVGIPEKYQSQIFDLFFRATNQSFGSGLGLYITRNAVEKMDGSITFTSKEGEGTRFEVTVPNHQGAPVSDEVVDMPAINMIDTSDN